MERRVWESRTQEFNTTINIARDQLRQRQQELRETLANRDQASSSCSLTSEELAVTAAAQERCRVGSGPVAPAT
jgi:adhesin transport system membrane fusion protein